MEIDNSKTRVVLFFTQDRATLKKDVPAINTATRGDFYRTGHTESPSLVTDVFRRRDGTIEELKCRVAGPLTSKDWLGLYQGWSPGYG